MHPLNVFLLTGLAIFLLSFISKRKHLLATLLSLEGLMLLLFSLFYFISISYINFSTFVLVFLTLTACEGALGLSLLIFIVRSFGGDKFNSLNFLNC
nr:NADH dehydrogenase subunit 4L [Ceriodaphnia dubia]